MRNNSIDWAIFIITSLPLFFNARELKYTMKQYKSWIDDRYFFNAEEYKLYADYCSDKICRLCYLDEYLFEYGYSLSQIGNIERSDSLLYEAVGISNNPNVLSLLGNNSLSQGKFREAEEYYKHAFYMVPNRLYPLTLLAKLYHTEGDTVRFLDMAEKVETFVPKVENANTERLRAEIREIKEDYYLETLN